MIETTTASHTVERVSRLRKVATCSCGWRSPERYSSTLLLAQWGEHAEEAHGASPEELRPSRTNM